ncbi:hypothetical protein BP6252_02115 [Coleophoma cylindrospora]|uniref:Dynactin subunit 4 n=1 Tax=Coleophoma cylindrospora TaxID=1849047 RepID=A0A3D8SDW3_9HELO|nr:hypothetical protein BP6252_02115 [Coleophoma cylindrospora]
MTTKMSERSIPRPREQTSVYIPSITFCTARSATKYDVRDVHWMRLLLGTARTVCLKFRAVPCTRSCFQCPVCVAPLSVNSEAPAPTGLGAEHAGPAGPFVLSCSFCCWSSAEIGIKFEKPNSIFSQLAKIKNGGDPILSAKQRRLDREERRRDFSDASIPEDAQEALPLDPNEQLDAEAQFSNLKSFYQSQLADASPASALGFGGEYGYGSPGALTRIMGLYTGGGLADKRSQSKSTPMREACDATEGLQLAKVNADEDLAKLRREGWQGTVSKEQRCEQAHEPHFVSDLRPVAALLRTKRSKRCKSCRHILSKPESKVQNTRFRIRLLAMNYIPTITIKPLQPVLPGQSSLLSPMKPTQFVLTFKNPLYDAVNVSIATPSQTPGRYSSKVTVLCPQFEVGAYIEDAWDDVLREPGEKGGEKERRRTRAETFEGQQQAEAGKVWESGRNWVSVVVEIVPATVGPENGPAFLTEGMEQDNSPLKEDEDILEIPVFVRLEWETDPAHDDGLGAPVSKDKEAKVKRELAYWCVLGVGRIAQV